MTGIMYVVKSGMLSNLNNLTTLTILDDRIVHFYGLNHS